MILKKNPIHGKHIRKFYERKWLIELGATGPAALVAAVGAWKSFESDRNSGAWMYLVIALSMLVVIQVIKVISAYKQEAKEDELRSHDGLQAALIVLHAVVKDALTQKFSGDPGLRATFHRVVPPLSEPEQLEQIVPYVGGDCDGEGRKFPIRAGITGGAVRQKTVLIMDRQGQDDVEYKKELISAWNYTEADVKKMTMDRFSAMAIPVTTQTGDQVLGVIYIDAKRRSCFSSEDIQKLVIAATGGITQYVGVRYV